MSPTQVDLVLNRVSVSEFKSHLVGVIGRQSFENSANGFELLGKTIDEFGEGVSVDQTFVNISDKRGGGGWLLDLANGMSMIQSSDLDNHAFSLNKKSLSDADLVILVQDNIIKGIKRNP